MAPLTPLKSEQVRHWTVVWVLVQDVADQLNYLLPVLKQHITGGGRVWQGFNSCQSKRMRTGLYN